jgi:hypothetical protein
VGMHLHFLEVGSLRCLLTTSLMSLMSMYAFLMCQWT